MPRRSAFPLRPHVGRLSSAFAALLLITASGAQAQDEEPDYGRAGVYGNFRLGFATPTELESVAQRAVDEAAEAAGEAAQNTRTDARFALDLAVGYRIHPRVSLEAQYQWINGFTATVDNDQHVLKGTTWLIGANVKGYVLTGRFQPWLMVGAHYLQGESYVPNNTANLTPTAPQTSTGYATRVGIGFDAYFTEQIAFTLGADYAIGAGRVENFSNVTVAIGAMYRF